MDSQIYELKLKPLSPWITDLTADTIFGHLCWQIKYEFWDTILEEFLEEMSEKPIFTLSDILPSNRLPRPITEWDGDIWEQNEDDFNTNTSFKKLDFIFQDTFKKEYLEKNIWENDQMWNIKRVLEWKEKVYSWYTSNSENRNIINSNTGTTWENWVYSIENNSVNDSSDKLRLLIKIFNTNAFEKYKVMDLLKIIFELTGFWKKKSTWKWIFTIESIDKNFIASFYWDKKEIEFKNVLVLSSFIPSQKDTTKWNYKIFTKFPKMWEEFSTEWQNFYKKPMIMLKVWATFEKDKNNVWYMWRMIKNSAINKEWIYHYAYWFTLEF